MNALPSICIPRVFSNMSEDRIRRAIDAKSVAKIAKIDIVPRVNEKGEKYNRVFVHFDHWFNTDCARNFRDDLLAGKELTIVYDEPWFWKVTASKWKSDPKYQSSITNKLGTSTSTSNNAGEGEDKDNQTKNSVASSGFLSKLFATSTVDNRPYRERRIDPVYIAQDVAEGFLERKPRPESIIIAPEVEQGVVEKTQKKREKLSRTRSEEEDRLCYQRELKRQEKVNKQRQEEEEERRYQDDLAYQLFLDIQQTTYERREEEKRYQEELERQEEVNRKYQEEKTYQEEESKWVEFILNLKEEEEDKVWFEGAAKLTEKVENLIASTKAAFKAKEEENRLLAEKEQQEKEVKKESRELESMRLQQEFAERYRAELEVYARKKEETKRYIEHVKSNPESRYNHAIPNQQLVRDYNEDYSDEFKGIVDPADAYTISFGDEPLPDPLTLRRPRRQIIA